MLLAAALSACAPRRLQLPSGDGEPFPAFAEAAREATAGCRDVRTIAAELGISGTRRRAEAAGPGDGRASPRPTASAWRARRRSVRPSSSSRPTAARATLLLPRDNRVATRRVAGRHPRRAGRPRPRPGRPARDTLRLRRARPAAVARTLVLGRTGRGSISPGGVVALPATRRPAAVAGCAPAPGRALRRRVRGRRGRDCRRRSVSPLRADAPAPPTSGSRCRRSR